jgi:hypothetical protein
MELTERFCEDSEPPSDPTPVQATAHRLQTRAGKALYAKRKSTVETVFGIIKPVIGIPRVPVARPARHERRTGAGVYRVSLDRVRRFQGADLAGEGVDRDSPLRVLSGQSRGSPERRPRGASGVDAAVTRAH